MPATRNHYEILNVAPDAESVVIEAAYRALMKKYHPDHASAGPAGGPSAATINAAYATLRDVERRADYDRREWTKAQNFRLAAYQAPPVPRMSRVFGWGGWVVALIMGGILAAISGPAADYNAARLQAARAAAAAEPDLRSQPSLPDEPLSPPPVAKLPADALALQAPQPAGASPRLTVDEAVQVAIAEADEPVATYVPAPVRVQRAERKREAARPRPRQRTDQKEFLEREGYIY
jgi:curved DNA-binding protein CbpA